MGVDSVRRLSEGSAGCGDLRGAVNPKIPDICHFPGKSGRCCIVRAVPGSAGAPQGHRVPGEAVLERERVYVIIGSYIIAFSTPLYLAPLPGASWTAASAHCGWGGPRGWERSEQGWLTGAPGLPDPGQAQG